MTGISTLLVGRLSDRFSRRIIMRIGSLLKAGVWLLRLHVTTPLRAFMVDSAYGITDSAQFVTFDALNYDKAEARHTVVKTIVVREIGINVSAALFYVVTAVFSLKAGLMLAAAGSLLFFLY